MCSLTELRPNRDLLDTNFSGYKLSLDPVPIYRHKLHNGKPDIEWDSISEQVLVSAVRSLPYSLSILLVSHLLIINWILFRGRSCAA